MTFVWYFVIVVYSFGGANPPQQIGPFATEAECKVIRDGMYGGPFGPKLSPCWSVPR